MNFTNVTFNKVIMHRISQKEIGQDHASFSLSPNLITIDPTVEEIIRTRLIDAAGKQSRAFQLEIKNIDKDSFYEVSQDFMNWNDKEFISKSQDIAELLAISQKIRVIPSGFLIIIEAVETDKGHMLIIIKAEPHEALGLDTSSQIQLLEQVFLSPSQKLYKIGILYVKDNDKTEINEKYGALLCDQQFRDDGHPANYFYKDFLGLTTSKNSKIQTLQFYRQTEKFILDNIKSPKKKKDLLAALKAFTNTNISSVLTPNSFANDYFKNDNKDKYIYEVVNNLPSSFTRDTILVKNKLRTRKMNFANNINIIGREENFDDNVKIINSKNALDDLNPASTDYTILKVKGMPFTDDAK